MPKKTKTTTPKADLQDTIIALIYVRNETEVPLTFTATYGPTPIEGEVDAMGVRIFEVPWYWNSRLIVADPVPGLVVIKVLRGFKSELTPPPPALGTDVAVSLLITVNGLPSQQVYSTHDRLGGEPAELAAMMGALTDHLRAQE